MKEAGTNLLHWLLNFSMVSIKRNSTDESLMWLISQENHNWWWLLFNLDHWLSKEKSVLLLERTKDGDISTDWHHQATEKSTKRSFIVAGTSQYKSVSDYFIKSEWCDQVRLVQGHSTLISNMSSSPECKLFAINCAVISQVLLLIFCGNFYCRAAGLWQYDKRKISPSPHTPRHSSLIWSGENIWLIYFGKFDPLQSSVLNCKVNSLMWQHSQVTNI